MSPSPTMGINGQRSPNLAFAMVHTCNDSRILWRIRNRREIASQYKIQIIMSKNLKISRFSMFFAISIKILLWDVISLHIHIKRNFISLCIYFLLLIHESCSSTSKLSSISCIIGFMSFCDPEEQHSPESSITSIRSCSVEIPSSSLST